MWPDPHPAGDPADPQIPKALYFLRRRKQARHPVKTDHRRARDSSPSTTGPSSHGIQPDLDKQPVWVSNFGAQQIQDTLGSPSKSIGVAGLSKKNMKATRACQTTKTKNMERIPVTL